MKSVPAPTESSASIPSGRRISSAPATFAFVIQAASFVLMAIIQGVAEYWHISIHSIAASFMQGLVAAWLSRKRGLAPWWPPIQFVFPIAVVIVQSFQLPAIVFLGGFLLLLGIFWSTFRTQVPFYPSSISVRHAVAALLPASQPIRFIDIGSGMGGLLLDLARRRPDGEFAGIELAPLPWLISLVRAKLTGGQVNFLRGDYNSLHFSRYDTVYAYLSPAAMPALWDKAKAEMLPGSLLLSYEFEIPGAQPEWTSDPDQHGRILYAWRM